MEELRSPGGEAIESTAPRQVVHSPERYRLDLPLAGPTSRILAYAIDYAAILGLEILTLAMLLALSPLAGRVEEWLEEFRAALGADPDALMESNLILVAIGFVIVVQVAIEWGYFIFLEMTTGGRSLGKVLLKLRVVGDGGHPLGFGQSIARNLLRAVDVLPGYYAVGLIAMTASSDGKRLGDLAAGTLVVRLDRGTPAASLDFEAIPDSARFRFDHAQVARLGRDEQRLLRQTLRRVSQLAPERADLVLERATDVLARRVGHEPVPADERLAFLRSLLLALRHRRG
jgi:uncharacterized RDD family membrane protein YckC